MDNDEVFYVLREVGQGGLYLTQDHNKFYFGWAMTADEAHQEKNISDLLDWFRYVPLNHGRDAARFKFEIVKVTHHSYFDQEVIE